MRDLYIFKTFTKETRDNRDVVPKENAKNLMDCKEIKRTVLREADATRSLTKFNRIRKGQATFFGLMVRGEKLEDLVTTGMIHEQRSTGK